MRCEVCGVATFAHAKRWAVLCPKHWQELASHNWRELVRNWPQERFK